MINILNAKIELKKFLDKYEDKSNLSFNLKVTHTYHVVEKIQKILQKN